MVSRSAGREVTMVGRILDVMWRPLHMVRWVMRGLAGRWELRAGRRGNI